jgi:prepilin signal peptidase PulO-like enzyme (type II secretory pathway)
MISRRDLSVLVLHLAVYAAAALLLPQGPDARPAWGVAFAALLIWVSVIDLRETIVPDMAVVLLLGSGAAWMVWRGDWISGALAGLLWFTLFAGAARVFEALRGRPGLGFGDAKLVAGLGLWVGLGGMSLVVLAAALGGIATMAATHLPSRAAGPIGERAIAFGPFLCLSAWAVWWTGAGT